MALYLKFSRMIAGSTRCSVFTLTKTFPQWYSNHIDKTLVLEEDDAFDGFTSHLLQQNLSKWEIKKTKCQSLADTIKKCDGQLGHSSSVNLKDLDEQQIAALLQSALDTGNDEALIDLISRCLKSKKFPPVSILLCTLAVCSRVGNKSIIVQIKEFCEEHQPALLKPNSNFNYFLAEAIWVKGDIIKSLELFEQVYKENAFLRRRIRLVLRRLIADMVSNRSEAALINILSFSERLLKDFKDIYPLTCVWQSCFLSEWYADQCTALELLERHDGLHKSVISRIPYVVIVSLRCHRTEVVYRLLEMLLKYDMKVQYSNVLATLLDYQFHCCDFHSCFEIIKWAVENDVELPRIQHNKIINLFLNEKMKTPLAPLKSNTQEKHKWDLTF